MTKPDPLSSLESERAVLGAVLLDPSTLPEAREVLTPGHFSDNKHRQVWEAICQVADHGLDLDILTVEPVLQIHHPSPMWRAELTSLDLDLPSIEHVGSYVHTLHDRYCRRRVRAFGQKVAREAVTYTGHGSELFGRCSASLNKMDEAASGHRSDDLRQCIAEVRSHLDNASEGPPGPVTGIPDIDQATFGLPRSGMTVLAGRAGMGKTRMVLQWLYESAKRGYRCAFRELEMTRSQCVLSICSQVTGIPYRLLRERRLHPEMVPIVDNFLDHLGGLPLIIEDQGRRDRDGISSWARRLHAWGAVDLVAIDHLQLVEGPEKDDRQLVSRASKVFKTLAVQLSCHVVALSQLSRPGERRRGSDFRPQLWDLKESGDVENNADVVGFIHREGYYDGAADRRTAEYIIAKQRDGWTGTIDLTWDEECVRFIGKKG